MRCTSAQLILALLAGISAPAFAQRLTIPEAVRRMKPGPYVTSRVGEVSPLPYEMAVRDSDVILQANLRKLGAYLSADETELFTDYEVVPLHVIADRGLLQRRAPGPQPRMVLQQWGGETTIEGVSVKIYDEIMPFLPTDTPLLLFLVYDAKTNKYRVFDGIAGAFRIGPDTRVNQLLDYPPFPSYEHVNGSPLRDVILEIHRLGR